MGPESTFKVAGQAFQLGRDDAGSGPDAARPGGSGPAIDPGPDQFLVLWDEVDPGPAGPWPAGGTVLFLWPHPRGDLRRPAWARRADEAEDEYAPWWNGEDRLVSAALALPFHAGLVAFLAEQAGPARFDFGDRLQAARAWLRRLAPLLPGRHGVLAGVAGRLAGEAPIERLAGLVEGAGTGDGRACTVAFGTPARATLHARREERCLWLWLAPAVRERFERFRDQAGLARFDRHAMDWGRTGSGTPAPRPPAALGR